MEFKKIIEKIKGVNTDKNDNNKNEDVINVTPVDLDVPKVIFKNIILEVTIGQWLGIFSSLVGRGNSEFKIYTHLAAEELMEFLSPSSKDLDIVALKFGALLKSIGVDSSETCVLGDFDKDKFTFKCHFDNSGEDVSMKASWGDGIDFGPELTIESEKESKTYDYISEYKERPASLHLQHSTIKNPDNDSSCYRFMSPYSLSLSLSNGSHNLELNISRPNYNVDDPRRDEDFVLKNEDELRQYLLGLSFPINIGEVYKDICRISIDSVRSFPKFKLIVKEKTDKDKEKITDMVSLSYGNLEKFVMTKDGRTIGLDGDDNWSYGLGNLSLSQQDGAVSYSLSAVPQKEFLAVASPFEQLDKANKEVNQAKVYVKSILGNN